MKMKKWLGTAVCATALATSSTLPFYHTVLAQETADIQQGEIAKVNTMNEILNLKLEGNLQDSSLENHSVTANGNVAFAEGRIGQGLHFQSKSQSTTPYLDLGKPADLQFGESVDFTVSFWVKSPGVSADPAIISNKDWGSGGNTGWFIGLNGSKLQWNYRTSESARKDASIANVADSFWHHIVVSHDRDGYAKLYKDGKLVTSVDISSMKGTIDTQYSTKIGVDGKGTLWGNNFDVKLDELQIFKKVLTDDEVNEMYTSAPPLAPVKVTGVSIDQPNVSLKTGGFTYLQAAVTPFDATNRNVTWISSNPEVAKVENKDGNTVLTAVGTGKAVITAKTEDGSYTAETQVQVTNSFDVTGDGLLLQDDMTAVAKFVGVSKKSEMWEEARKADLNLDEKVTEDDIHLIKNELKKYKNDPYKHVFVIGLDGAGTAVKDGNAPNIQKFISEGAVTYSAQSETPTISAQNWGAMLHGVGPEKHKLTNDIAASKRYPESSPYPSFMKVLKQERPQAKMAAFSAWTPINYGIIEQSAGAYMESVKDDQLVYQIADYIKNQGKDTRALFVQLDDMDGAGHNYGYGSQKYYEQLEKTDKNVGVILDAIREAGLIDESLILMVTDHGGKGYGHGGTSTEEKTVFWAAHGPNIKPGTTITDSVMNKDTAAVVAEALRLEQPETWDAEVPEDLFEK